MASEWRFRLGVAGLNRPCFSYTQAAYSNLSPL
jgi:hypothetical protein